MMSILSTVLGAMLLGGTAANDAASTAPETKDGVLNAPYFYVDANTTAVLELTNNTTDDKRVVPELRLFGQELVVLDPLVVPAETTVRLALPGTTSRPDVPTGQRARFRTQNAMAIAGGQEPWVLDLVAGSDADDELPRWGDGSRAGSVWGSLQLRGDVTGLNGWILSTSPKESLAINAMLKGGSGMKLFHSMWWKPTPTTKVRFAVQNPHPWGQRLYATVFAHGQQFMSLPLLLRAGETLLVDLDDLFIAERSRVADRPVVGSVLFFADADARVSGVFARGVVVDEATGFSVPLGPQTHLARRGNELHTPGTVLGKPAADAGFPAGTLFSPHVLLQNIHPERSLSFRPVVYGTAPGERWELPAQDLGPHEQRVVDIAAEFGLAGLDLPDGFVSVSIEHDGLSSQLVAETVTVSVDEGSAFKYSFYDPMFDKGMGRPRHIAVSFNLSGPKNTLLTLKNASSDPSRYSFRLTYATDNGPAHYYRKEAVIAPHQLLVVDIGKLRDEGIPDAFGNVIPPSVRFGSAVIDGDVFTGDPTYDPVAGTCNSCTTDCCAGIPGNYGCDDGGAGSGGQNATCENPPDPGFGCKYNEEVHYYGLANMNIPGGVCDYSKCPASHFNKCGSPSTVTLNLSNGTCKPGYFRKYSTELCLFFEACTGFCCDGTININCP